MIRYALVLFAALAAAPATATHPLVFGQTTPSASTLPVGPPICLPTGQTALPSVATKLVKGARYVISCRVECDVLAFPDGLVKVEQKTGPRSWTAIFAGGTGDYEDREFTNPYLYALKATGTGQLNLVVIPRGYKDKNEWVRALIDVDVGGPRPPPVPPVPVPPVPVPPDPIPPVPPTPTPTTGPLFLVVVEETSTAVAERGKMFNDPALKKRINERLHRWRCVDKDVVGADGQIPADIARFLNDARGKALPQVYFVDSKTGRVVDKGNMPSDPAALLSWLIRIGG